MPDVSRAASLLLPAVDGAKPYPYHSWTGVQGAQDATEAQAQVQEEEASLSPQQQAQLQQVLQN